MAELASSADCPKCGAPPTTGANCPKCGLAKGRWATFAANEEAKVTAPIRFAWDQLAEHWEEPTRHSAILELAAKHNVFAWIGAKYRVKAKEGDPLAATQLEKLKKQAEVTLMASAAPREDNRKRNSYIAILVAIVVLGLVSYVVYSGTERPAQGTVQTK